MKIQICEISICPKFQNSEFYSPNQKKHLAVQFAIHHKSLCIAPKNQNVTPKFVNPLRSINEFLEEKTIFQVQGDKARLRCDKLQRCHSLDCTTL